MTSQENKRLDLLENKVSSIENKIDNLPDELIRRLDDRYFKKEDAHTYLSGIQENCEKKYVTMNSAKVAVGVFTFILVVLSIVDVIINYKQ